MGKPDDDSTYERVATAGVKILADTEATIPVANQQAAIALAIEMSLPSAVDSMSALDFEDLCRHLSLLHMERLKKVVDQFEGQPLRIVTLWCVSFLISITDELRPSDKAWIDSALRKAGGLILASPTVMKDSEPQSVPAPGEPSKEP